MTSADYGAIPISPSDIEEVPPNTESDAASITEEERIKLTTDFVLATATTLLTPIPFFFIGALNWRHFPPDPHSVLDTYFIYLGFVWPFATRAICGLLNCFVFCFQLGFGKLENSIKARTDISLRSIVDILVRYFVARNMQGFHQQYSLGFGWALHGTLFFFFHGLFNYTFWSSNLEQIRDARRAAREGMGKRIPDTPWWLQPADALMSYPQQIAEVVLFAVVPWYLGLAIVLDIAEHELIFRKILLTDGFKTIVLLGGLAVGLFIVALAVTHRL